MGHALNMDYDTKFYLPFMNMIRSEGYWTPHWLDIHPNNENIDNAPEKIHDPDAKQLSEWNNGEGFDDPNTFELKERSRPHKHRPGKWGPPPSTPPKVLRMEPPKPTQHDLEQIAALKKTMHGQRLHTVTDGNYS